jgi:hypothetical protein
MPSLDWLKRELHYGYDSGGVLDLFPRWKRRQEEARCGTSLRRVFYKIKRDGLILLRRPLDR